MDGLGRRVQHVAQALDRDLHLLEVLVELGQAQHRGGHLGRDHVEGDERADRQFAVDHRLGAEEHQQRRGDAADVGHAVLRDGRHDRDAEGALDVGGEALLPLRLHHRLDGRGLHGLDAHDGLDQELLADGAGVELLAHHLLQDGPEAQRHDHVERDRQHHDDRQLPRIGEEHRDEDEGEDEVERREQALAGQEGADVLEFADARHGLAGGAGLEIGERQAQAGGGTAAARVRRRCGWWCG